MQQNGERERDYRAVAQIYQQLKKSYDTRLDFWTATNSTSAKWKCSDWRCHRKGHCCGGGGGIPDSAFVAWYRYASDYGNSYVKPMLCLLGVLILFAGMFPLPGVGLQRSSPGYRETYSSVWRAGNSVGQRLRWEAGLAGKSLLTAVDTATFQKGAEYVPAYPWGRTLAIAETLLTSTLFAHSCWRYGGNFDDKGTLHSGRVFAPL